MIIATLSYILNIVLGGFLIFRSIQWQQREIEAVLLNTETAQQNKEIQQENEALTAKQKEIEQSISYLKSDCAEIQQNKINLQNDCDYLIQKKEACENNIVHLNGTIELQEATLREIANNIEASKRNAEIVVREHYESEFERQKSFYTIKQNELSIALAKNKEKLQEQEIILEDLKQKQIAIIQAKQREEEIAEKANYYKLNLSSSDLDDIAILRKLQTEISHKEAIDKIVWDVYYKPAYDKLMPHLFNGTTKVSGIYKITSQINGQSYIGQSVDIRERFRSHIKTGISSAPATNKLYQAMKKDGLTNFTFEILEKVPKEQLNEREIYYIELYQTKTVGMNSTQGGS